MPRSLDPNSTLVLVLAADLDKNPQPKFFAKQATVNQQRKLLAMQERIQTGTPAAQLDALLDAVAMCLTGWENIPLEFNRENIGEVLTVEELTEVFGFLASGGTGADKKKSELPPL